MEGAYIITLIYCFLNFRFYKVQIHAFKLLVSADFGQFETSRY